LFYGFVLEMALLSKEESSMEISRRMAFVLSGLGVAGAAALTLGAAVPGNAEVVVAPQKVLYDTDGGSDGTGSTKSLGSPGSPGSAGKSDGTGSPGGPGGLGGDNGQQKEKEVKGTPLATETGTPTRTPAGTV
jgi:hypothetical protein